MHNSHVSAFGAGNIPSFAYLEGRAFRHGDIEDTLGKLFKKGGGGLGIIGNLIGKGGTRFNNLDVKRVYFGNWLRDYSQAVDIAGLKKLQLQSIINLCIALGFLAHGYATGEFEVTVDRLGVYLPTEHIDNPKGYGEGEDARKYDARLRGPVDPRELEIDPRTGMKNYIANEDGGWDTSKGLVRKTLQECIRRGRAQRANGQKADEYEAYRLLGQALHTLEDFPAHTNFCELALWSMGYTDVFLHVGDQVRIQAPGGKWVAPLVTGTFGSSDFIHSLLGEATDHISQASVTDLNAELDNAKRKMSGGARGPGDNPESTFSVLQDLLSTIPSGGGSDMRGDLQEMERIRAEGGSMNGKPPEELSPQELHAKLWAVLTIRDRIVKKIEKTIERIPGLGPLIEKITENISVFVFTTLEPILKPLMKTATAGLMAASGEVIDNHDQYEVFNIPTASDPTHSFLSKDHFNLLLNEPAGVLAKVIVTHAVNLVVRAWDDPSMNVHNVTEEILEAFFHPDFHNTRSQIQREMMKQVYTWINGLGEARKRSVLERLRKEAVRNHKNIRLAGEGGTGDAEGGTGQNYGHQAQAAIQGYVQNVTGFGGNRQSGSHSSAFAPSYGSGGGFPNIPNIPNIPGIPGQMPNIFGGSGFGKREGPEDMSPQPSPYASSYAPPQPSYDDGGYRSIPPEPSLDQSSTYASPFSPPYAPSYPESSGGGYQPSYDPPPTQFGLGGGTGGYGDGGFSGGFGYGWSSESQPQPQPQPQNEGTGTNEWQGDQPYGFSGGFPDPQQRFGY